ncbi:CinA family protein [Persicitalea jodogahamensis]|uniref:Damage-inducible protein CinA n=1 Tax=Persicitalea jodogahamensis TaxID=402147 RepID=A0A8J3D443_9BACT|nr:nicotinamide-nucleotide amidohydrolase family protein [Persicitalea jodogahamensis]GHB80104.1 damage-inducible protein CinA [Persicitalea jodogahamensis]
MPSHNVIELAHYMREQGLTISFAESASTGRFVDEFTRVPDCGSSVLGSIVCYDESVKTNLLKVPREAIEQYTAESPEVTQLLADQLKKLIPANIMIAVTGLASPGGSETPEKPVGTMFVHGFIGDNAFSKRWHFTGEPDDIIAQTIHTTANFILNELKNNPKL